MNRVYAEFFFFPAEDPINNRVLEVLAMPSPSSFIVMDGTEVREFVEDYHGEVGQIEIM